jgi:hypothetical protein
MAGIPFLNRARKIPRSKGEVAKDVAVKETERIAVGVIGFVPIAIAVVVAVIVLLVISVVGVLGHASQDPNFAQQTGLDSVFNNTPGGTTSGTNGGNGGGNPEVECQDPDSFFTKNNIINANITDPARKLLLCKAVATLYSYPEIERYMINKSIVFRSSDTSSCPGFWVGCTSNNSVSLHSFETDNRSADFWSYIITHEMLHAIDNISDIENGFQDPYASDKSKCYAVNDKGNYILKSYGVNFASGLGAAAVRDESFAESGAVYITGRGTTGNWASFRSDCPGNTNFWSETIGSPSSPSDPNLSNGTLCTQGTTNTCGGKYNISKNPTGLNFGDPSCELVSSGSINRQMIRDELLRQLQAYDKTKDYCRWSCIAYNEAGYNPNSYNGNASRPNTGAWGMFQFLPWACYDTSRPYNYNRTGNLAWREQITRALALEYKALEPNGISWNYWSTARNCVRGKFRPAEPDWNGSVTSPNCVNIGN